MRALLDPVLERAGQGLGPLRPAMQIGAGFGAQRRGGGRASATWPSACSGSTSSCCSTRRRPSGRRGCCSCCRTSVGAVENFDADEREFMTWVALHEVTHAVQFAGVPWLHGHVAGLVRELLAAGRAADRHAAQAPPPEPRGVSRAIAQACAAAI